ncbi:MAG TPA: hypothetical protein VF637_02475, partial [Sphingomicrobium sp.]
MTMLITLPAVAQGFNDQFDRGVITNDPTGRKNWTWFTGDGQATMTLSQENGLGVVQVDATHDQRGIWWALIKRSISAQIDVRELARADRELHIEARVRSRTAPRRVNLSVNHTRTTDFHHNLAEFDLPDTGWHTIAFTTRGFDARQGDEVFAQMALVDWGLDRFQVDIDWFKVTVVDPRRAPPDQGEPLPYRPPIAAAASFSNTVLATADATLDTAYPSVNFSGWVNMTTGAKEPLLATSGSQLIVLRFDLSAWRGRAPDGWGVLELTTESVARAPTDLEEFGYLRAAEILGGAPIWRRDTVTLDSFLAGRPRAAVLGQMFMDTPPAEARGAKTRIHVSPPVMRRLLSGEAKGIAIYAQGAVNASFFSTRASQPVNRPV